MFFENMKNNYLCRAILMIVAFVSCISASALTTDIYNASDLRAFRDEVNSNPSQFSGVTVRLHADINLGGETWTPIAATSGTYDSNDNGTGFVGIFDGQGYIVSNFVVNVVRDNNWINDTNNYAIAGFFGLNKGVIKNLWVSNADITAKTNAPSSWLEVGTINSVAAGGIAGLNGDNGLIDNCCVSNCRMYAYVGYKTSAYDNNSHASGVTNNYGSTSILKNSYSYNNTIIADANNKDTYKRVHVLAARWERTSTSGGGNHGFTNPEDCCAVNSTCYTQVDGSNNTNRVDNATYTYSSDYTSWRSGRNNAAWLNNNIPGYENSDEPYTWDEDGITPEKHYYAMISNDIANGYRDGAEIVSPKVPTTYKRNDGVVDVYTIDYVNSAGEAVTYTLYPEGTTVQVRVGLEGWDLTTLTDGKVKHAGYFVDKVYYTYDYTWDSSDYTQEEIDFIDVHRPTEVEITDVLSTLSPTTNRIRRDQYFSFTTQSAATTLLYTTVNRDGQLTSVDQILMSECVKVVGNSIIAPVGAEVYNVDGVKVGTENLSSGIYIVRLGQQFIKVIVR